MRGLQIVMGGTSGMGLATAIELGKTGPVLVGGRSEKRIGEALAALKDANVEGYAHVCDISDLDSLKAFADFAQDFGKIGNVVNAAGVDFDTATSEQIVRVNMKGTVNVVNCFMPLMKEGSLVLFSSITGDMFIPNPSEVEIWDAPDSDDFCEKVLSEIEMHKNPMPNRLPDTYVAYSASKSFVIHYAQANAQRFGEKGLRIFSVAPGSFLTPMLMDQKDYLDAIAAGTALKRVGEPKEMACFIKHLVDPELAYLTGCDLVMDGGKMAVQLVKQLD